MAVEKSDKSSTNEVTRVKPFERFTEHLKLEARANEGLAGGGGNIAAQVIDRMLEADSLEAAIEAQDSTLPSGKNFVDVEHVVHEFTVRESDAQYSEHGLGSYVVVDGVRLDNGESVQYATGAPNVVALLYKARQLNRLPLECVLRSKPTQNGELLMLKLVPPRVIKG